MDKKPPCKKGERRNPKTGECVKMSDEVLKYKQWQRNKKKGVEVDEEGHKLKPDTPEWKRTRKTENKPKKQVTKKNMATDEPVAEPVGEPVVEPVDEPVDEPVADEPVVDEPVDEPVVDEPVDEPVADEPVVKMTDRLYPTLDDPDFAYKIAQRQEFADTKYEGEIKSIREQADKLCDAPFELMPHQLFVRNFMSFQTPYNSLLLYHGLGSGKTCSAIGIAEEMRAYMKQMGITKRIIIVASPNVQDNFRLQLFDERRLEQLPDGTWNLNTCIGNALLQEINPTNLRGLTREKIVAQIRSLINQSYVFMGNKGEFANYIQKAIHVPTDYTEKERAVLMDRKIKAHFNNRLVILDEIHNIRISDSNKTKLTTVLLNKIARKSDNMRLLLLSATPMYNSYQEIIWLTNLLNANDNRPEIAVDDVFQADGSFIESSGDEVSSDEIKGKELLLQKLTGYVSYVRGENPYIFPYRIYPETFAPDHVLGPSPSKQMNQKEITDPLQFIPVYKNGIGAYQSLGYDFILRNLGLASNILVDKLGRERAMPTFENMEQFGYTLLMEPLESLIMVYPNPKLDKRLSTDKPGSEKDNKDIIKGMIGKQGLSNVMKFSRSEKPIPRRYDYEYRPAIQKQYGDIFSPDEIGKYSAKIANVCDILRKPSQGIVLIYSQYIDGGLVPMALALESMGFTRYASTPEHSRGLLKHKKEPIDANTMQPKGNSVARYVMITGEKDFSQNNNEDIKYVTNQANANGENVKVILISMAASEGLDFKNIRQIHILEPWYNMNRVEQIIGRGVRNLSHCHLPFEERNVEIYLHGTVLDKDEEAADVYVYRSAEKKAVQIGRVTRVLKEISVDCLLNLAQTNFTETKLLEDAANRDIHIRLSSRGDELLPFRVGDKPRTEACDYMENCELSCATQTKEVREEIIKDTYDENFVKTNSVVIMKKVRDLFKENMVYRRDHLVAAMNRVKKYPMEHIYYALTRFVQNKSEGLVDKYGRSGYLVSRGEYYAFQPAEIMDEAISTFERSNPVDYKPVSLRLEVPKEIRPWPAAIEEEEPLEEEPKETNENNENNENKENKESKEPVRTYEEIVEQIRGITALLSKTSVSIPATQRDWYKHVVKAMDELTTVHEMELGWIQKYVVFHYLDKLSVGDKLVLISRVPREIERGPELLIKLYFDARRMTAEEDGEQREAVLLANGSKNQLFIKGSEGSEGPDSLGTEGSKGSKGPDGLGTERSKGSKGPDSLGPEGSVWNPATYTDEQLFAKHREQTFVIPKEKIHRTEVGFMHPFKEKEVVFKMKDLTQKRNNTGAKCTDASKQAIASKIGVVLGQPSLYTATQIEKPELCVILEMLMRWKTESRGVYYFFGPEMTNEMKLSTLHW